MTDLKLEKINLTGGRNEYLAENFQLYRQLGICSSKKF